MHGKTDAQLYTELGAQHNQFFTSAGYSQSFYNVTYGINHTRYFKRLKTDITGVLDFSSPLSDRYYTKFIFRKGFQINLFKKNNYKIPVSVITSSVKRHLTLFNFHDLITDVSFLPGIYKSNYTFAAELSLKLGWFHKTHFNAEFFNQMNTIPPGKNQIANISAGIVFAYNKEHFSLVFKGGFQQVNGWELKKTPVYALGIFAYKLNFVKHK